MHKQNLSLRDKLAKNYINAIGWHTSHKYILIESDDWGAIRMTNGETYNLLTENCGKEGCFFDKYDSLETQEDLHSLYDVLTSVKDSKGNNVVFQPYAVVANPNYEKIEQNGFQQYFYESFLETYKRYAQTEHSFDAIKEGINAGIWHPQSHSREHIQVRRWMKALQDSNSLSRKEFSLRAFHSGCCPAALDYYCAYGYDSLDELSELKGVMKEGLNMFEDIYGYRSISFCAPCGIINKNILDYSSELGVKLGSGQIHYPNFKNGFNVINHFWGDGGENGMIFYRRNCKFEPSRDHNIDWADKCMKEIEIAFRWGKPAVIDSHRVNYIGSIDESNRTDTLRQLSKLLKMVVKRWPDVEFINSEQLYNIITEKQ